ncbi:MAG TPA: hypothetical protein VIM29_06785 [Bacillota bacterium]
MKKSLLILVMTVFLCGLGASVARANASALEAENGQILSPAGLGLQVSGNPADLTKFKAQAAYGIAKSITVGADWYYQKDQSQELYFNASFSPYRDSGSGYTAYLEYYPVEEEFTGLGITFWNDFNGLLYTYLNLDSSKAPLAEERETRVTPGVSLQLTPRVRVAAELAINPANWNEGQELRVGVGYRLASQLTAKTNLTQLLSGEKDRTFTAGLALEI